MLVRFEQIKQACIDEYSNIMVAMPVEMKRPRHLIFELLLEKNQSIDEEFKDVETIDDLVNTLDGLGNNGNETYRFIFDCIIK